MRQAKNMEKYFGISSFFLCLYQKISDDKSECGENIGVKIETGNGNIRQTFDKQLLRKIRDAIGETAGNEQ